MTTTRCLTGEPEVTKVRSILHADLDAFFTSVEQLDNPDLRGKPVLVGGTGNRAVVAAASYEARAFGCHSAMPTAVALSRCPQAIVVKGRGWRYRDLSRQVFEIFESVTPIVEPLSIDEAFLDVTGSVRLLGEPVGIADAIRTRVRQTTGLTISVGVAPNKFLAKLASEINKPDGLAVITPETIRKTLDPMPVTAIFGVGKASKERFARLGIHTIGQLRNAPDELIKARLGSFGPYAKQLAAGIDDRPVVPDRTAKSVGHEETFESDLADLDQIRGVLLGQVEQVARRLRTKGRAARTITLKIRFGDFETITRSHTLETETHRTEDIWKAAQHIFESWSRTSFRPVRLIGVSASQLTGDNDTQLPLFGSVAQDKLSGIDKAADEIAKRFGSGSIRRAGSLPRTKSQISTKKPVENPGSRA